MQDTVPVPKMLFSSSGKEAYPFAIFQFCQSSHIYDIDNTHAQELSYVLGNVLAKIHDYSFPEAGLFGKELSIDVLFKEGSSPYFEYCLVQSSLQIPA